MRTTNTHIYFWDGFMSNWHPAVIWAEGIRFYTSEHYFMWLKARHFNDLKTMDAVANASHPGSAKKLGRQIVGFNDDEWVKVRYDAMVNVNIAKYRQNPELLKELLNTGDHVLVEASPVDKIWGIGLAEDNDLVLDEKNWQGTNLLGKALMEVRNYFKLEQKL